MARLSMGRAAARTILVCVVLAAPGIVNVPHASAGEVTGLVTDVLVRDSDGLVYVLVAGTGTNRPACAATTSYWMIPNENSEAGKKLYALLLAAKVSGMRVQVIGKNTCLRWGDGEDILYVNMH